jgi:hypothetical protein
MSKQIPLTSRANKSVSTNIDAWVDRAPESKPHKSPNTKRLTFDLDADVHSQLKIHCVTQGLPVTDFLRALIAQAILSR